MLPLRHSIEDCRGIRTISATNHIGDDHTAATSKVHISANRQFQRVTIGIYTRSTNALWNENGSKQQPATFKANCIHGLLKPTQAIRQLLWTLNDYDTYPTSEARARAGGTASLCQVIIAEVQASVISSTNLILLWNRFSFTPVADPELLAY